MNYKQVYISSSTSDGPGRVALDLLIIIIATSKMCMYMYVHMAIHGESQHLGFSLKGVD